MGRQWQSPAGNFFGSTLIDVRDGDPPPATLGFVAALALFNSFAVLIGAGRLRLKWPNDVLALNDTKMWAKISGILLERREGQVVLGIGANLAHAPHVPDRPVTSVAALGIAAHARDDFLSLLATQLSDWLARWRSFGLKPVRAAWLACAHPVGTSLSVALPDGVELLGAFDGLENDCALRLRLANGELRVIHAGDVFLI